MEFDLSNLSGETWEKIEQYGVPALKALVILIVAYVVAGLVKRSMMRAFTRAKLDLTLSRFFSSAARYAIITFAVIGILATFGIETSSFAAVIAAMGLAVGLAFQGTLGSFAAGMMLLIFRPFKVGDVITASGVTGAVEEIDLFTCTLIPPDGRVFIVPNGAVFGNVIENITGPEQRRVDIDVGTDYGKDCDEVRAVLEKMIVDIPGGLEDPPPQVFLSGLGASSVDWQIRVWCNTEDYWDVYQAIIAHTKKALDEAEIGIPFPQTDVHFDPNVVTAMGKS